MNYIYNLTITYVSEIIEEKSPHEKSSDILRLNSQVQKLQTLIIAIAVAIRTEDGIDYQLQLTTCFSEMIRLLSQ